MNEADQHLLTLIQSGDHDGWNQFVARFQKRLMAFAIRQVGQQATAEDVVQETFIAFLKAVADFREECELESFLFQILRRRIVDQYRRQGRLKEIPVCAIRCGSTANDMSDAIQHAQAADRQASWYVRRDEHRGRDQQILAAAIRDLTVKLQTNEKFHQLKIAEGLFYAGLRNQELAEILATSEQEIGLVKHRLVKRLNQFVQHAGASTADSAIDESAIDESWNGLLTAVWEEQRPSCPKRTSLGKFTLGILPSDWHDFVDFHVNVLHCRFCEANLEELQAPQTSGEADVLNQRLFQSTVGFLRSW